MLVRRGSARLEIAIAFCKILLTCSKLTVKIGQYSTHGVSLFRLGVVPLVTGRIKNVPNHVHRWPPTFIFICGKLITSQLQ